MLPRMKTLAVSAPADGSRSILSVWRCSEDAPLSLLLTALAAAAPLSQVLGGACHNCSCPRLGDKNTLTFWEKSHYACPCTVSFTDRLLHSGESASFLAKIKSFSWRSVVCGGSVVPGSIWDTELLALGIWSIQFIQGVTQGFSLPLHISLTVERPSPLPQPQCPLL